MAGQRPSFEETATGENTCPPGMADNIIWEGDILAVHMLLDEGNEQILAAVTHNIDMSFEGYEWLGLPAVMSLSESLENPEDARQQIEEQIEKNILLRGGEKVFAGHFSELAGSLFVQYRNEYAGKVSTDATVSDAQKAQFFTNMTKVPDVLKRAIDQDDIKIVVDNSRKLEGSVPGSYEGSSGLFLDGNLFVSAPYDPDMITEEMVHYADRNFRFSASEGFMASIEPLVKNPGTLLATGYVFNKDYALDGDTYELDNAKDMAAELLADMYLIRNGFAQTQAMTGLDAGILLIDREEAEKMSRLEGMEDFYNRVVRGKTPEQIEEFYEERKSPLLDKLRYTDEKGYGLALSMAKVPEEKMDEIFKSKNDPEALLRAIYPEEMIEQLDGFVKKVDEQYPAAAPAGTPSADVSLEQKLTDSPVS